MPKPIVKEAFGFSGLPEYELLRQGAESLENQTRNDALLLSGLRYVEAQRLQENPDWLDDRFVYG